MYFCAMPPSKKSPYRINMTASGLFAEHLAFLRQDTALEDASNIRLAVAELAKKRGYVPPPQPAPKTKK